MGIDGARSSRNHSIIDPYLTGPNHIYDLDEIASSLILKHHPVIETDLYDVERKFMVLVFPSCGRVMFCACETSSHLPLIEKFNLTLVVTQRYYSAPAAVIKGYISTYLYVYSIYYFVVVDLSKFSALKVS